MPGVIGGGRGLCVGRTVALMVYGELQLGEGVMLSDGCCLQVGPGARLVLGDHVYLEIIAVQPGAKAPADFADLAKLDKPAPLGWAVSGGDLKSLRRSLEKAGFALTPPEPGSRTTPEGATLHWQTFGLARALPQAPFFIVWSPETPHPSATSPEPRPDPATAYQTGLVG